MVSFPDLRNGGLPQTDWHVSDDKPPATSDNWGQQDQGPSDLVKVVLLGAPGVGKSAIAQVCLPGWANKDIWVFHLSPRYALSCSESTIILGNHKILLLHRTSIIKHDCLNPLRRDFAGPQALFAWDLHS